MTMNKTQQKAYQRMRRHNRIRAKVSGTAETPRLAVYRSSNHITAQLIDDTKGVTVASANDVKVKVKGKIAAAQEVGKAIAEAAKAKKIEKVVFDRGGFLYAGRVKALAEAAREGGLAF